LGKKLDDLHRKEETLWHIRARQMILGMEIEIPLTSITKPIPKEGEIPSDT